MQGPYDAMQALRKRNFCLLNTNEAASSVCTKMVCHHGHMPSQAYQREDLSILTVRALRRNQEALKFRICLQGANFRHHIFTSVHKINTRNITTSLKGQSPANGVTSVLRGFRNFITEYRPLRKPHVNAHLAQLRAEDHSSPRKG